MKTSPKKTSSRLHIDWTRCDGRGLCTELLPGVLSRDDWGYPLARDGSREPLDTTPGARLRPRGRRPMPATRAVTDHIAIGKLWQANKCV